MKTPKKSLPLLMNPSKAADSQSTMILDAAQSFEKMDTNISGLIEDIQEISAKIEKLADSNNQIVKTYHSYLQPQSR